MIDNTVKQAVRRGVSSVKPGPSGRCPRPFVVSPVAAEVARIAVAIARQDRIKADMAAYKARKNP